MENWKVNQGNLGKVRLGRKGSKQSRTLNVQFLASLFQLVIGFITLVPV